MDEHADYLDVYDEYTDFCSICKKTKLFRVLHILLFALPAAVAAVAVNMCMVELGNGLFGSLMDMFIVFTGIWVVIWIGYSAFYYGVCVKLDNIKLLSDRTGKNWKND